MRESCVCVAAVDEAVWILGGCIIFRGVLKEEGIAVRWVTSGVA